MSGYHLEVYSMPGLYYVSSWLVPPDESFAIHTTGYQQAELDAVLLPTQLVVLDYVDARRKAPAFVRGVWT